MWSSCKTSRAPRRQHLVALSCLLTRCLHLLCMQAGKVQPAIPSLQLSPPAAWSPRGCCQQAAGQRLPLRGIRGRKAQVVAGVNTAAKRGTQCPQQASSVSMYWTQSQNAQTPHVQLSKGEGFGDSFTVTQSSSLSELKKPQWVKEAGSGEPGSG